jgi:hypothetical protein
MQSRAPINEKFSVVFEFFYRVTMKSIGNPSAHPLKHGYLDAGHGVVGEAGDDGLNENPCAVGRCLDDNTLELVITFVLPLGLDADSVTDYKGYGLVARDGIFAVHDA